MRSKIANDVKLQGKYFSPKTCTLLLIAATGKIKALILMYKFYKIYS